MDFSYILILALLGGVILNIMPCVLPVVSLKVLSVIKARKSPSNHRLHFLAITAGIIVSFIILAVIMSILKAAGQYAGLGFSFQQPAFIIALILILIFFACNVNNSIYIDLPHQIKTFLSIHSNQSKLLGSFLSGVFATMLATPCTAPFLGTAISFAFALTIPEIIVVFVFIGTGMSMPFIILYFFPQALKVIPPPGSWLIKFNKFIEVLIYITIMWLFWIVYNQIDLTASLVLFMFAILFKFILERGKDLNSWLRSILTVLIIFGSFALPLNIEHTFQVIEDKIEAKWQKFSLKTMEKAIKEGKIVLVDITAEWCLTCKYNKIFVLDTAFMLNFSNQNNMVLLRGDYTSGNDDIELFLAKYNQYGIPFNVVLNKKHPKGIVLPTILKAKHIREAVQKIKTKNKKFVSVN